MSQVPLIIKETQLPGAWRYSVMRKGAMAVSGLALVTFLYGHWAGNTVLLDGENAFNDYWNWLQGHPVLHYGAWLAIAISLIAHLAVGPRHWLDNRRARPIRYRKTKYAATNWAARSMMVTGTILLMFVVLHIAQVRGWIVFDDSPSIYRNIQAGFERWPVVTLYILGQVALATHLYHGLWSQFQTLGIHHPRYNRLRRPFAVIVGGGVAVLNICLVLLSTGVIRRYMESAS
jgi:succinate dehydrogenase / fumarate reductase cytochrome b subunit